MSILPLPLLRRRSLLPGESLPSLLMRLGKVNHYDPPSIVNGLAVAQNGYRGYCTDISRYLSPTILERLTAITKLDPFVLYSSTYHRYAPIITPPEIDIEALKLADDTYVSLLTRQIAQFQLRPGFAVQFCPKCLRRLTYHRLIWVPIVVSACLEHKCLLINRCPHCDRPITMKDIFERCCSRCQVSLVEAQSIDILDDEFGLFSQQVIQSWLQGDAVTHHHTYSLPEKPARVLYRFLYGLRTALMKVKPDWSYLHRLPMTMQATASMDIVQS
jgi:TniQ